MIARGADDVHGKEYNVWI